MNWSEAWELFKGISPVLVAIMTILINNKTSLKRDIKNKSVEIEYLVLCNLLDKLMIFEEKFCKLITHILNEEEYIKNIEGLYKEIDTSLAELQYYIENIMEYITMLNVVFEPDIRMFDTFFNVKGDYFEKLQDVLFEKYKNIKLENAEENIKFENNVKEISDCVLEECLNLKFQLLYRIKKVIFHK